MARVLQLRRGTTAENNLFTGAVAEATYDTDRKELRIHDGSTVGGKVVSAPTGAVMAFAGSSAPEGWLVCDGSAVSRTTYADLFAVIGTTYGDGDGNTTFNLPSQSPTHKVIATQEPTAANNYTWYRKYDDGWVEQGGIVGQTSPSATITITIPVEMADTNYMLTGGAVIETNGATDHREGANEYISKSTTLFQKFMWQRWTSFWWKIDGMAASGSTQQNIMCIKY